MPGLDDLHYMLGEMNGKMDLLLEQGKIQDDRAIALEARVRALESRQGAYNDERSLAFEKRLRAVENRQHWYAGAAAMFGAAAAYVFKGWESGGHG